MATDPGREPRTGIIRGQQMPRPMAWYRALPGDEGTDCRDGELLYGYLLGPGEIGAMLEAAAPAGPDLDALAEAMSEAYTYEDRDNSQPSLSFVDDGEAFWRPFAVKVRAALAGNEPGLDVERLAETGVNVWGWPIGRSRQYAETFAAEYARLGAAVPPGDEG